MSVKVTVDVTDTSGYVNTSTDRVVFRAKNTIGAADTAGRVISTAPVIVELRGGAQSVNLEPGPHIVTIRARGQEDNEFTFTVPDDVEELTLRDLLENHFDYDPEKIAEAQRYAVQAKGSADAAAASEKRLGSAETIVENTRSAAASAATATTEADRAKTEADRSTTKADTATTEADRAGSEADRATEQASASSGSAEAARADAVATAADRVKTTADVSATAADRVQTGQDRTATGQARSRTWASADKAAASASTATTEADRATTEADRAQAAADSVDTDVIRQEVTDQITAVVDGAPKDLDTIREVSEYAQENRGITDTLNAAIGQKADKAHTHAVADVAGLQAALDGKAASSHTHTTSQVTGLDAALGSKLDASKIQVVAELPESPVEGTIYLVTGA